MGSDVWACELRVQARRWALEQFCVPSNEVAVVEESPDIPHGSNAGTFHGNHRCPQSHVKDPDDGSRHRPGVVHRDRQWYETLADTARSSHIE